MIEAMRQENLSIIKNAFLEWAREEAEPSPGGGHIGDPGLEISYDTEGVRLNKEVLDNAGFTPGDKLQLSVRNGQVTVRRA